MRTEQEVFVTDLVHKYQQHLVQRGGELVEKGRKAQMPSEEELARDTVIFSQLLDGCFLTLAYTALADHRLFILDWRFTDPACN